MPWADICRPFGAQDRLARSISRLYSSSDPMRAAIAQMLHRLAARLGPKAIPTSLAGNQWTGTTFVDVYKRNRNPTPNELLAELKNTAFTCSSINAAVCAAFPPRLYVATHSDEQPRARCL